MLRRITKTERRVRAVVLHVALVAGSIIFAVPFIWLFSTSCKVPDEMYPPRWLPQIPGGVKTSPYVALRRNEQPKRPVGVSAEDWVLLSSAIREGIRGRTEAEASELPDFYGPYLASDALAEGILGRLLKRAPDEVLRGPEDEAVAWFVDRVTKEMIRDIFETVYRRVAVSDVVCHGWDIVSVEKATADAPLPWKVVEGDATLIKRQAGLLRPAQEVHYSFEKAHSFVLEAEMPLEMAPENLKKVVVATHGDRSWHEIWATVELDGKRFEATEAAFIQTDRWQDVAWQFESEEDASLEMKTWIRLRERGASDYAEEGRIHVTLEYRYNPRIAAAYNKYVNNYREVFRRVPLFLYVKNSLFLVALNICGQILGSSLVAFSFARLRWPAREFCFVLVLATLMIPPQVTMIPVFLIYKNLGWYNTLRPLWVHSFFGSAFYIFLLRQFMRGIPGDLEDSAKIDGCGYLGIYWRIILPLVKPALAAIGIFTFLGAWNDFMGPLVYLSDQELYPLSLGLFALKVVQGGNFGLMMAASVLMTFPVIVLFFAAQRHFIQGITLTGLKG